LVHALRPGGIKAEAGPEYSKYDRLNEGAAKTFEVADIDEADVVVYPFRAETGPETEAVAEEARKRHIGCVFFSWGDADEVVNVPYGKVYRHSLFSDRRLEHEQAWCAEVTDPQTELGMSVWPREKHDDPKVGFCGYVSNPIFRAAYRLMGRQRKAEGLSLRARVLRGLNRTKNVETSFITRQAYWAGARGRWGRRVAAELKPRAAFWNNVLNTDYTLCIRGAGNFSYRFYEVLAAGRIPLFINTRCVLPFDDEIDWRRHCVWVEEDQIDSAGEILKDFHSRLSPSQFIDLQLANRRIWETRLNPLSFYRMALAKEVHRAAGTSYQELEVPELLAATA